MIRLLTLAGLLSLLAARTNAQVPIEVYTEKDNAGIYTFYARNNNVCPYTVTVDFTQLTGFRASISLPYQADVRPGQQSLFRLEPQPNQSTSFQYRISYQKGCLRPRIDTSIVYLLPVGPGKTTTPVEMPYLGKVYAGESEPKDWYALAIKMNTGDTVFAARRGVVSVVRDDAQVAGTNLGFHRDDNSVEIVHQDCSFATYTVFRQKGIFVKPGQFVEAGEPLGIVGGENYSYGPHVRFNVHYNYESPIVRNGERTDQKHYWAYVPIRFWLKTEQKAGKVQSRVTYASEHPDAVIEQEMSKREIKNWQKKHAR